MVKAAVILRINPMPDGFKEFDIQNGGWAMVDGAMILIYGHGVERHGLGAGRAPGRVAAGYPGGGAGFAACDAGGPGQHLEDRA